MKFKIGDRVRLREDHLYNRRGPSNPLGVVGIVISFESISLELRVEWANGFKNSYKHQDLFPATKLDKLLAGIENAD